MKENLRYNSWIRRDDNKIWRLLLGRPGDVSNGKCVRMDQFPKPKKLIRGAFSLGGNGPSSSIYFSDYQNLSKLTQLQGIKN